MKKMIMMVVALLSMTATYAETETEKMALNTSAYDMHVSTNALARALTLSFDQREAVEDITADFAARMRRAGRADEDVRSEKVRKAVNRNLAYMRSVLTGEQYRQYTAILQATFVNRGLEK